MDCPVCGTRNDPTETACEQCRAVLDTDADQISPDAPDALLDEPTQVLPTAAVAGAQVDGHAEPVSVRLAPPVDETLQTAAHEAKPAPSDGPASRDARTGALVGVTVALLIIGGFIAGALAASGGLGALAGSPPAAALRDESGPIETGATEEPSAVISEGYSCSPQSLAAPVGGRWELYRAELGSRQRSDYVRLKLRRGGPADEAASVAAELVPIDQTGPRFGVERPSSGDVALVLTFAGPVVIAEPFGSRPGYAAVKELRIVRADDKVVHAVVGINGRGCFMLSGADWQTGQGNDAADITVEVERP